MLELARLKQWGQSREFGALRHNGERCLIVSVHIVFGGETGVGAAARGRRGRVSGVLADYSFRSLLRDLWI